MNRDELHQTALEHHERTDLEQRKSHEGIYSLSREKKAEIARKTAEKLGKNPWTEEQIAFIREIISEERFSRGKLLRADELSRAINERWYGSRVVRTPRQVSRAICRFKLHPNQKMQNSQ